MPASEKPFWGLIKHPVLAGDFDLGFFGFGGVFGLRRLLGICGFHRLRGLTGFCGLAGLGAFAGLRGIRLDLLFNLYNFAVYVENKIRG